MPGAEDQSDVDKTHKASLSFLGLKKHYLDDDGSYADRMVNLGDDCVISTRPDLFHMLVDNFISTLKRNLSSTIRSKHLDPAPTVDIHGTAVENIDHAEFDCDYSVLFEDVKNEFESQADLTDIIFVENPLFKTTPAKEIGSEAPLKDRIFHVLNQVREHHEYMEADLPFVVLANLSGCDGRRKDLVPVGLMVGSLNYAICDFRVERLDEILCFKSTTAYYTFSSKLPGNTKSMRCHARPVTLDMSEVIAVVHRLHSLMSAVYLTIRANAYSPRDFYHIYVGLRNLLTH
jgi:hypothetical protein